MYYVYGCQLWFYRVIQLVGWIRDVKIEDNFKVGQKSKEAILGISFFSAHSCKLDFGRPVISIDNKELICTHRHGRLVICNIQVWKKVTILAGTKSRICCRVTIWYFPPVGMIEGYQDQLLSATSHNIPDQDRRVMVRYINPGVQPQTLRAGCIMGSYTGVEDNDIHTAQE